VFKGIVYNEMKGMMMNPDYNYLLTVQKNLFRGTAYSNDSGGDPVAIPSMTHKDLTTFHAEHYHPSNATFFIYGDQEIDYYLDYIDETVLSQFERSTADTSFSKVPRVK
jgi:Zn-dependent M16 (insulinase) family peptidase